MRISVSLSDSTSFFDGVLFVLLLIAVTALVWTMLSAKAREPLNIFTCVLAIATIGLTIVSFLQWRTLDKTDETFRAGERAFVFVTHNGAQWQPAKTINGEIFRVFPVVWENSGNSPTSRLTFELHCPEIQQSVAQNPMQLPSGPSSVHKLLGPKQSIWAGVCGYSVQQLNLVRDNGYHLYIASTADYYDIFDAHHRGRNCADKECDKP